MLLGVQQQTNNQNKSNRECFLAAHTVLVLRAVCGLHQHLRRVGVVRQVAGGCVGAGEGPAGTVAHLPLMPRAFWVNNYYSATPAAVAVTRVG